MKYQFTVFALLLLASTLSAEELSEEPKKDVEEAVEKVEKPVREKVKGVMNNCYKGDCFDLNFHNGNFYYFFDNIIHEPEEGQDTVNYLQRTKDQFMNFLPSYLGPIISEGLRLSSDPNSVAILLFSLISKMKFIAKRDITKGEVIFTLPHRLVMDAKNMPR